MSRYKKVSNFNTNDYQNLQMDGINMTPILSIPSLNFIDHVTDYRTDSRENYIFYYHDLTFNDLSDHDNTNNLVIEINETDKEITMGGELLIYIHYYRIY